MLPFLTPLSLHGAQAKLDLTYCQHCHAAPFNGGPGSNPRFNVPLGRGVMSREGCEACHRDRTAHPVPWAQGTVADHKEFGRKQIACALCHGASLLGPADSPAGVGPSCRDCHNFGLPLATDLAPTPLLDCTSCHSVPPNGVLPAGSDAASGDVRPNQPGAHAVHNALPKVATVCSSCHNRAGTGTAAHYDTAQPANIAALPAYLAKNANAVSYVGGSCSNVSCHGGVSTPAWGDGAIDRANQCEACHTQGTTFQTPQYNSWWSGEQDRSIHIFFMGQFASQTGASRCRMCHDAAKLEPAATQHFSALDTPDFETLPATTVRDDMDYNGTSCNPRTGGAEATLGFTCHGEENWLDGD